MNFDFCVRKLTGAEEGLSLCLLCCLVQEFGISFPLLWIYLVEFASEFEEFVFAGVCCSHGLVLVTPIAPLYFFHLQNSSAHTRPSFSSLNYRGAAMRLTAASD